jgi:hypothetical protein
MIIVLIGVFSSADEYSKGQTNLLYVRETTSEVYLGNEFIEIGFVKRSGALWSILHKEPGVDLRTRKDESHEALWEFWMIMSDMNTRIMSSAGRSMEFYSGYTIEEESNSLEIRLQWSKIGVENYGSYPLSILASARVFNNSPLTEWSMSYENLGEASPDFVHFPLIIGTTNLGTVGSDDFLVFPASEGRIFNNPSSNSAWIGGDYPSRQMNMQFMAYYDSVSGFYLSADDTEGYAKHFWYAGDSGTTLRSIGVLHWLPTNFAPSNWQIPYRIILGSFKGDWITAASIYKDWTSKQWWAAPKVGNHSIPRWIKELSIGWMEEVYSQFDSFHNQTYDEFVQRLESHSNFFRMPVSPNIEGWCKYGIFAWGDILPPNRGWTEFDKMLYRVHQLGSRIRLSVNPFNLDISTPLWNSNDYLDCCAKDENGEIRMFLGIEPPHALMCVGMKSWRDKIKKDVLTLVQHGVDMIMFDGFPTGILSCYDKNHNHTIGCGGNWWAKTWIDFLEEMKTECKAVNAEIAFGGEDMAEIFLPFLDTYDNCEVIEEVSQWACSGGVQSEFNWEYIPLFRYVYYEQCVFMTFNSEPISQVIEEGSMGDTQRFNILCIARALTRGETLVYGFGCPHQIGDVEWDSVGFEFARKCAEARATYAHAFLVEGNVLMNPNFSVPSITIDWRQEIEFIEPAILLGAWRDRDARLGFVFTNMDNQTIEFNFSIDLTDYEMNDTTCVHILREGIFTPIGSAKASFNSTFEMAPLEILLVVFSPVAEADLWVSGSWLPHPKSELNANTTQSFNATFCNLGSEGSGPFNISFSALWIEGNLTECSMQTQLENLNPGNVFTEVFDFEPRNLGHYLLNFTVDAEDEVSELDESNNSIELLLESHPSVDLNGDGKVNIQDIAIVAIAYGSEPVDPHWNAVADLDKNSIINIVDVTMVAKDYGKTV